MGDIEAEQLVERIMALIATARQEQEGLPTYNRQSHDAGMRIRGYYDVLFILQSIAKKPAND